MTVFNLGAYDFLSDADKTVKPLATLTCTVLRGALPKIPLPVSMNRNPIQFPLPRESSGTPVESAVELSVDPSSHLQASHSAPQLTGQTKHNTLDSQSSTLGLRRLGTTTHAKPDHAALSEVPTTAVLTQPHELSSRLHATACFRDAVEKPTSIPSGSKTSSSSVSVDQCHNSDKESSQALSQEDLTLYSKFFPELEETGVTDTLSSPQLVPEAVSAHQLHRHQPGREEVSCQHACSSLLEIPTAPPLTEPSDTLGNATLIEGTSSLNVSDGDGKFDVIMVNSVLDFAETPTPHVYGHVSRPDPESFYKRVPSVVRLVFYM